MKPNLYLLIFFVLLIFGGCISIKPGYFNDDKKLAMRAVEKYHQLYNEKNFEEIYEGVHEEAKATKDKQKLIEMLSGLYQNAGKVESSELVRSSVRMLNAKERQVELVYRTQHENEKINETFLVITNDTIGKIHTFGELSDDEVKNLPDTYKKP
jgi:hypothetical protein